MKETDRYHDIIHLPHHVSSVHQRMSVSDRAAQFSPFAALTGHEDAIKETARLTDEKIELDEDKKTVLNKKLQRILEKVAQHPVITVVYFLPDEKKTGGTYVRHTDHVKRIDEYEKTIIMGDGKKISMEQIYEIIE